MKLSSSEGYDLNRDLSSLIQQFRLTSTLFAGSLTLASNSSLDIRLQPSPRVSLDFMWAGLRCSGPPSQAGAHFFLTHIPLCCMSYQSAAYEDTPYLPGEPTPMLPDHFLLSRPGPSERLSSRHRDFLLPYLTQGHSFSFLACPAETEQEVRSHDMRTFVYVL
jgi:hypothetical protein